MSNAASAGAVMGSVKGKSSTSPSAAATASAGAILGTSGTTIGSKFTALGIIVFASILWIASQNGSAEIRSIINRFLAVLLLSIVLLNWSKISPLFFKA